MAQTNLTYQSNRIYRAELSRHARIRAQQPGIPATAVKLITAYGERSFDNQGGIRYLMTEQSVRSLIDSVGYTQQVSGLRGAYVVLSADDENKVITVARRYN